MGVIQIHELKLFKSFQTLIDLKSHKRRPRSLNFIVNVREYPLLGNNISISFYSDTNCICS